MASAIATVAVLVLAWIATQQAARGTLRQWAAAKFLNAAEPNRSAPKFTAAPPRAQHQGTTDGDGDELPFPTSYSGLRGQGDG